MTELDYAFVADYARVEPNGTLTAIGASWTHLWVSEMPTVHRLSVAGRVRATAAESSVPMRIEVLGPDGEVVVGTDFELQVGEGVTPYRDNRIGLLFAIEAVLPILDVGRFQVRVLVTGECVRDLYFEVGRKVG